MPPLDEDTTVLRSLVTLLVFGFASNCLAEVDTVVLNYGWTPGIYTKVTGYNSREKFVAGVPQDRVTIDLSYVMSTKAHPSGLQIDFLNVEADMGVWEDTVPPWLEEYMEKATEFLPSYLIDPQGQLLGVTDLQRFRESMLTSMSEALVITPEFPQAQKDQLMAGMEQTLSEEVLNQQLLEEWMLNVGQWIGAELDDDGVYQTEFEAPVAVLNNQLIKTYAEFEFAGRVNCDDRDADASCVVLHYRTATDDISMNALLENFVDEGTALPDFNFNVTHEMELVVHPDTLLTYYRKSIKRAHTPLQTPQGLAAVESIETTEYQYLYVMGAP